MVYHELGALLIDLLFESCGVLAIVLFQGDALLPPGLPFLHELGVYVDSGAAVALADAPRCPAHCADSI